MYSGPSPTKISFYSVKVPRFPEIFIMSGILVYRDRNVVALTLADIILVILLFPFLVVRFFWSTGKACYD